MPLYCHSLWTNYVCFFFNKLLTITLLEHGYVASRLKSSTQFYGCHHLWIYLHHMNQFVQCVYTLSLHDALPIYFLWATWQVFQEKQRMLTLPVHLVHAPSGVRVAHLLLLLCTYYLHYFMFFTVYVCFPCRVFDTGLCSSDLSYNFGSLDN